MSSFEWFHQGSLSFEIAKGLPAAVITLLIGLFAAGVAFRQWKVGRAKLKLDMFEKRFEIFEATWSMVLSVTPRGEAWAGDPDFLKLFPKAEYLFDDTIRAYMEEIVEKRGELSALLDSGFGLGRLGILKAEDRERFDDLIAWFTTEASVGCRRRFSAYLEFSAWR